MERLATFLSFLTLAAVACFIALQCAGGLDDPEASRHALESSGYSRIELGEHVQLGCSQGDTSAMTFNATSPVGKQVSGTVCCGLVKACTVRF